MAKPNDAIQLWVTGDADFRSRVKEKAAQAKMDMQDYIRNVLDVAIGYDSQVFFSKCGNGCYHSDTDET